MNKRMKKSLSILCALAAIGLTSVPSVEVKAAPMTVSAAATKEKAKYSTNITRLQENLFRLELRKTNNVKANDKVKVVQEYILSKKDGSTSTFRTATGYCHGVYSTLLTLEDGVFLPSWNYLKVTVYVDDTIIHRQLISRF